MRERPPIYQINKTNDFIEKCHLLGKDYKRMPELIRAIEWELQRNPHGFQNFIGDFYFWITEELESKEFPAVKIFYKIIASENKVVLLEIEIE